ncbi:septum formation initiator family protein [Enterococcus dongliensis]|uniref:Septum formation initiator family protein n=1 Tax=Enterococcus dongliensis TaxID=2559925 RepID=A0AAP5KRA9_9ENTE|nr:septum formation initiator family protein [Enterococcus dongliensis]MDT2596449.1 septum formation initiator family protein [Enterococcus dongliensis]MDT2604071.1 septum formation initiator family protein [Enterococcus dongliensis]MDT2634491.1 septum formation initiator family protein [Enterococcus dongliensis]MDT2636441.1 septum formation initiator family protein [Enterococcus dongliensis]MDT2640536.1 septum formation initiator family protein [Enterococcus dongliensis]
MNENETPKIASLDTPYAKEQYRKFQKQHRQLIFKRRRLAVLFAVAAFAAIVMGVQIFNEQRHLSELKEIKTETIAKSAEIDNQVSGLKQDVELLKDENYVAKLARSRFYYSKEDELIFVLPDSANTHTDKQAAEK